MKRLLILVRNFGYFDLGRLALKKISKLNLSFNSWYRADVKLAGGENIKESFEEIRIKKMIALADTFDRWEKVYHLTYKYFGDGSKEYQKLSLEKIHKFANSYKEWEHAYIISIGELYASDKIWGEGLKFAVSLKEISFIYRNTSSLYFKAKAIEQVLIIKQPFCWWYKRLKESQEFGYSELVLSGMRKHAKRHDHWEKIYYASRDLETKELSIAKISEFIVI